MKKRSSVITYIILIAAGIFFLLPFITMVFNAFKPHSEIIGYPPSFFPKNFTLSNFINVIRDKTPDGNNLNMHILAALGNSIFITVARTALTLYLSALWGYTLSKVPFRGREVLFYVVLSAMMVPTAILLLPLFQEMLWLNLRDTYLSQIIVINSTTSYAVFIMRQFMLTIPDSIIEAARIDGCSELQIFHKIIFPLLKNAISAICIIVFLYIWNDYLWPSMMMTTVTKRPITVVMQGFNGQHFIADYGGLMAATCLSLIPIFIIYIIFHKRFTQGIALSGTKE